jgi:hypothetical protein
MLRTLTSFLSQRESRKACGSVTCSTNSDSFPSVLLLLFIFLFRLFVVLQHFE